MTLRPTLRCQPLPHVLLLGGLAAQKDDIRASTVTQKPADPS
jgi:hypothetical protein